MWCVHVVVCRDRDSRFDFLTAKPNPTYGVIASIWGYPKHPSICSLHCGLLIMIWLILAMRSVFSEYCPKKSPMHNGQHLPLRKTSLGCAWTVGLRAGANNRQYVWAITDSSVSIG